jgi:hypothetical protein
MPITTRTPTSPTRTRPANRDGCASVKQAAREVIMSALPGTLERSTRQHDAAGASPVRRELMQTASEAVRELAAC